MKTNFTEGSVSSESAAGLGGKTLRVVVIGGSGLIGKGVVEILSGQGHEVVVASPSRGVNTLTGEGLAEALAGADVVVDVANSPSFEDEPVMQFFDTAGRNIAAAEKAAGVKLHVALSVVGTDRMQGIGYFRAKLVQENHIKSSGVPYTILRATQFFEFVSTIVMAASVDDKVVVSSAMMQPILAADVSAAVSDAVLQEPLNGIVDMAGPDRIRMNDLVAQFLKAKGDAREVVTNEAAGYFGAPVDDSSLVPLAEARMGSKHFTEWLAEMVTA